MEYKNLSVEKRDEPPMVGAIKITGIRYDGLPDGVHCGAWLFGDKVYKSLHCRPFANSEWLVPSGELEVLMELQWHDMMSKNWSTEMLNGRPWLVRPKCIVAGTPNIAWNEMDIEVIERVEKTVREINREGWEINDLISLAFDPKEEDWFILDMSAAQKLSNVGATCADDTGRVMALYKICGYEFRPAAFDAAQHCAWEHDLEFHKEYNKMVNFVYSSFSRPITTLWANFSNDCIMIVHQLSDRPHGIPHSFVLSDEALTEEEISKYELYPAWERLHLV